MEAEEGVGEFIAEPIRAQGTVIPVISRGHRVHQRAVYPHTQLVVSGIRIVSRFHAIPGISRQLRAAIPLRHFRGNVIGEALIGAQDAFDLAYTNFIAGIGSASDAHNMFVVIARLVTQHFAEVYIGAHMQVLYTRWQGAHNLRRICTATEVHRVAAIVGFGVIHQGVVAGAQAVVIAVKNPADKCAPAIRRSTHGAALKVIAKKHTGRHR